MMRTLRLHALLCLLVAAPGQPPTHAQTAEDAGEVVWEMELPGGTTGAPMSYMAGGRQYIVVAVGWEDLPGELVALALP